MSVESNRPYRKNLTSQGLIYMGGEEYKIVIKDLSLSGVLAQLSTEQVANKTTKDIFKILSVSTSIDIYLPEIRLAGEAEVVRMDVREGLMLLALDFKNISYDVDGQFYKRKVYRKNLDAPGKILLNDNYRDFHTINVSVDGLMIKLEESLTVDVGLVTVFEIDNLELEGEVIVKWLEPTGGDGTLLGLQYVHMGKSEIKGIPSFSR